jgi:DNA-binding Lrp family transcriptional regulator
LLDELDFRLLEALRQDGRMKLKTIATRTGVSIPTVHTRIERLRRTGVIKQFTAVLGGDGLSPLITGFFYLKATRANPQAIALTLKEKDEIEEVFLTTGMHDIIVKASFLTMKDLDNFIRSNLSSQSGVEIHGSSLILQPLKEQFGPTLRPALGIKLYCYTCKGRIKERIVRRVFADKERFFCSDTCSASFRDQAP